MVIKTFTDRVIYDDFQSIDLMESREHNSIIEIDYSGNRYPDKDDPVLLRYDLNTHELKFLADANNSGVNIYVEEYNLETDTLTLTHELCGEYWDVYVDGVEQDIIIEGNVINTDISTGILTITYCGGVTTEQNDGSSEDVINQDGEVDVDRLSTKILYEKILQLEKEIHDVKKQNEILNSKKIKTDQITVESNQINLEYEPIDGKLIGIVYAFIKDTKSYFPVSGYTIDGKTMAFEPADELNDLIIMVSYEYYKS
jgi:hypothetical protein